MEFDEFYEEFAKKNFDKNADFHLCDSSNYKLNPLKIYKSGNGIFYDPYLAEAISALSTLC